MALSSRQISTWHLNHDGHGALCSWAGWAPQQWQPSSEWSDNSFSIKQVLFICVNKGKNSAGVPQSNGCMCITLGGVFWGLGGNGHREEVLIFKAMFFYPSSSWFPNVHVLRPVCLQSYSRRYSFEGNQLMFCSKTVIRKQSPVQKSGRHQGSRAEGGMEWALWDPGDEVTPTVLKCHFIVVH